MAWTAPRTWVVAEIVTAALMNTHVRDDLRYLKGLDGVPTIQNGLIVDNALGTEYLQIPSLTTTQRDALTPVNGMAIYNSTLTVFQRREAGAWISYNNLVTMVITSQAQGDIFYASSATAIARLGAGTSGWFLKTQGAGANPIWAAASPSASGSYTGDAVAGRAISHGLGITPKMVFITGEDLAQTTTYIHRIHSANPTWLLYLHETAKGAIVVTAMDATNFYLGSTGPGANESGRGYAWMAIG